MFPRIRCAAAAIRHGRLRGSAIVVEGEEKKMSALSLLAGYGDEENEESDDNDIEMDLSQHVSGATALVGTPLKAPIGAENRTAPSPPPPSSIASSFPHRTAPATQQPSSASLLKVSRNLVPSSAAAGPTTSSLASLSGYHAEEEEPAASTHTTADADMQQAPTAPPQLSPSTGTATASPPDTQPPSALLSFVSAPTQSYELGAKTDFSKDTLLGLHQGTSTFVPGALVRIKFLPPESEKPVDPIAQKNVDEWLTKRKQGISFNAEQLKMRSFNNPYALEKLATAENIDQSGSNYPPRLYPRTRFDPSDFYPALAREQQRMIDEERNQRTAVDFTAGSVLPPQQAVGGLQYAAAPLPAPSPPPSQVAATQRGFSSALPSVPPTSAVAAAQAAAAALSAIVQKQPPSSSSQAADITGTAENTSNKPRRSRSKWDQVAPAPPGAGRL